MIIFTLITLLEVLSVSLARVKNKEIRKITYILITALFTIAKRLKRP